MAAHAHTMRARPTSTREQPQEPRLLEREAVSSAFDGGYHERQSRLNQFLSELASPQLVSFILERERKLKLRH